MNIDIDVITKVVIPILGAIILYVIRPLIRVRMTNEQLETFDRIINQIRDWIRDAVKAAEQLQEAGRLEIPKKEYVWDFMIKKLDEYDIEISAKELDLMIEAMVKSLKIEMKKDKKE